MNFRLFLSHSQGSPESHDATLQWCPESLGTSPWQRFLKEKSSAPQNNPAGQLWPAGPIFPSTVPHQTRICLRRLPWWDFSLSDIFKIFFKELTKLYLCGENCYSTGSVTAIHLRCFSSIGTHHQNRGEFISNGELDEFPLHCFFAK